MDYLLHRNVGDMIAAQLAVCFLVVAIVIVLVVGTPRL